MSTKYANAMDVLSPEFLAALQDQFESGRLWVPSRVRVERERRRLVFALHAKGVPTAEIARRAGVRPRRVSQILAGGDPRVKLNRILDVARKGVAAMSAKRSKKGATPPSRPRSGCGANRGPESR